MLPPPLPPDEAQGARRRRGGVYGRATPSLRHPRGGILILIVAAILTLIVAPHVVDSQSVKAPEAKTRGYDAGKKIVGRKRHIAVDTDGRLLMVNLTPADISDSAGAQMILDGVRKRWPWPKHLFADGAYDRTQLMDEAAFRDFTIQIIKRSDAAMGFEVIPRRWVVERTFAWMTRWRRLVRDYEERIDCSQAMIHVALGSVLLRRIAHE